MMEQTRDRIRSARYRVNGRGRALRPHRAARRAADQRTRVVVLGVAVIGLMTLLPLSAAADLSPEIQADLYLVQTEAYIQEKDYAAAREAMGKIVGLQEKHGLAIPNEFHFKYAQVLSWAGSHAEAVESLNRYLELAGRSGTHYRDALVLLHEATEAAEVEEAAARVVAKAVALARNLSTVVVPAGSFLMGSPSSEEGRSDWEGPQHWVTIKKPFAVGVYEVTFEEWDACVSAGGCGAYRPDDNGWGRGRRPVINVDWEDAQRFVEWLRDVTGQPFRLLSESEWEYAARAGTTTPYHYGRTITVKQANGDIDERWYGKTLPVGSFDANEFGLHDVHGNVSEWVQDCSNDNYRGAPRDGSAWEAGDCSCRVLRGGEWNDYPSALRSASRSAWYCGGNDGYSGGDGYITMGFRVARTLTP